MDWYQTGKEDHAKDCSRGWYLSPIADADLLCALAGFHADELADLDPGDNFAALDLLFRGYRAAEGEMSLGSDPDYQDWTDRAQGDAVAHQMATDSDPR